VGGCSNPCSLPFSLLGLFHLWIYPVCDYKYFVYLCLHSSEYRTHKPKNHRLMKSQFQGITAQSLGLPSEVFELMKNSIGVSAVTTSVKLATRSGFTRTPSGLRQYTEKYLQKLSVPQRGVSRDMGLNALFMLVNSGAYEYAGQDGADHVFVRTQRNYTPEQMELFNSVISNSPTFLPESKLRITPNETGEIMAQGLDETQILRVAYKDKVTGRWSYLNYGSFEEVRGMKVAEANVGLMTTSKYNALPTITEEEFYNLSEHKRTFINVDREVEPCSAFTDLAFDKNDEDGTGIVFMEFLYNEKTNEEKPFQSYTAPRTGQWSWNYQWEWSLYNEKAIPDHIFDGENTMEDTAAAMAGTGNFGKVVMVQFGKDDARGKHIAFAPISGSQEPHYNPETHTFYYDPTKVCLIEGKTRLLPLNGGKEATYETILNVKDGRIFRP